MKKSILLFAIFASTMAFAQVGIGTSSPSDNSILDLRSTTKGFLLPRLTTAERTTFGTTLGTTPDVIERGMQVYDTDTKSIWFWDGTSWIQLGAKNIYDSNGDISPVSATNRAVNFTNGGSLNFDSNLLFIDATNNKIGINTATPFGRFSNSSLDLNNTNLGSDTNLSFVWIGNTGANLGGFYNGNTSGSAFTVKSANTSNGNPVMEISTASTSAGTATQVMGVYGNGAVTINDKFTKSFPLNVKLAPTTTAGQGNTIALFQGSSERFSFRDEGGFRTNISGYGSTLANAGIGPRMFFSAAAPATIESSQGAIALMPGAGNLFVGVNTNFPTRTFHVDPLRNNTNTSTNSDPTPASTTTDDFVITSEGNVGVGTISPTSKLEVNGRATNTFAIQAQTGVPIDFSLSNLAYSTLGAYDYDLHNMKEGGVYTFIQKYGNGGSITTISCSTNDGSNNPTVYGDDYPIADVGEHVIYNFMVIGGDIYVTHRVVQ